MFFSSGFNPVTLFVSINVSNSPADNTEFNESHLLFRLNYLKQALAKNSITETIGCIPLRTASKIVVNLKAADSGLLITNALGIRPDIRVTMSTINKNNKRSYIRFENLFTFQKSLAKPLLNQPTAIREIVTPN